MVHLPHLGKLRREVKEEVLELDAPAEAGASPFHKKSRLAQPQQWNTCSPTVSNQQLSQHDFLDEPSPLGLRLKKSPSLVDLIQMKLLQADKAKDSRHGGTASVSEKLKASNFPGSILRIGSWEWVSRYEGDLVAKCYFAKHKLVWEVLDGGLKSKIEIQWSDICALKVVCPENEPGTLEIALSRQPLFFRETNPQPRKHTLWQATSDFTNGQASMHRKHFLQCQPGMMNKHVEKLVHCDPRLYSLSQQSDITLENPYFESCSIFEDPEDIKLQDFERKGDDDQLGFQSFRELVSPRSALSTLDVAAGKQAGTSNGLHQHLTSSVTCSQVMKQDAGECEPQTSNFNWNGLKLPGIRRSMSKSDIANHIGHHIYRQIYLGNLPAADGGDGSLHRQRIDEITRYLLNDTPIIGSGDGSCSMGKLTFDELTRQLLNETLITAAADERMLMSRVNSLCSLIQRDTGSGQTIPSIPGDNEMCKKKPQPSAPPVIVDSGNGSLPPRKESFGDLLMHNLPRISSFPHFL